MLGSVNVLFLKVQRVRCAFTDPVSRVQIQIFSLPMLKEARQTNAIVRQMRFFTNHNNVEFPSFLVHLDKLFSKVRQCQTGSPCQACQE